MTTWLKITIKNHDIGKYGLPLKSEIPCITSLKSGLCPILAYWKTAMTHKTSMISSRRQKAFPSISFMFLEKVFQKQLQALPSKKSLLENFRRQNGATCIDQTVQCKFKKTKACCIGNQQTAHDPNGNAKKFERFLASIKNMIWNNSHVKGFDSTFSKANVMHPKSKPG